MQFNRRARALLASTLSVGVIAAPIATSATSAVANNSIVRQDVLNPEVLTTIATVANPDADRRTVPEDRYAMALGCYEMTSVATGTQIGRGDDAYGAFPGAFHFEPTELGMYLLLDDQGELVAADHGPAEQAGDAVEQAEYYSPIGRTTDDVRTFEDRVPEIVDDPADYAPAVDTHLGTISPGVAGPSADWHTRRNVDGTFTFTLPAASGRALSIVDGYLALADAAVAGDAARFRLANVDAQNCASWPEIEINVDGPLLAGDAPWDETRGTIDAHLHLMAFEFLGGELRCGQPWHRYGVTEALKDCYENEHLGGRAAEAAVGDGPDNYGDDVFWPEFTVPTSRTLTYEQVYYRWLERAWRAGLRMMTVLMVENNVLCEVYPEKRNSCDEMDSVRLQIQRVNELVNFLDARAGGPGEGFAQIARTPFEAREIVNSGRLALVLGIEVSTLFGCREYMGTSDCTNADILEQLDEMQALGVTQMELVNKFDNALSGVKGDGGTTGIIVNNGNKYDTGHWWPMGTCPTERAFDADHSQMNLQDQSRGTPFEPIARDQLAGDIFNAVGMSGAAPLYPAGPHCNKIGLLPQGEFLLQEMAARGMLFDPDHMSGLAASQAMDVMEELGYSGIVSSHGWAGTKTYERIYGLGGTITKYAGGSSGFLGGYYQSLNWIDDRYYYGYGYGADMNGLGGQGGPRNPDEDNDVDYPFVAPGGAVVSQQVSGVREPYDINTDGVAHYGMYADWIEDLRVQGGTAVQADMLRGPEAYLQTWERAVGVPKDACYFGDGTTDLTDLLTPGMTFDQVLMTAGQPHARSAEGYTYCGLDDEGNRTDVLVEFADEGVSKVKEKKAKDELTPLNTNRVELAAMATGDRTDVVHVHDEAHGHEAEEAAAPQADGAVTAAGLGVTPVHVIGDGHSHAPVAGWIALLLSALAGLAVSAVAKARRA